MKKEMFIPLIMSYKEIKIGMQQFRKEFCPPLLLWHHASFAPNGH
jgi:hypothetical protein